MPEGLVTAEQVYKDTCENIRKSDDISFKLISLTPLLSGGSILTLLGTKIDQSIGGSVVLSLALFAGFTTLALFRWELRNIQTCNWLRERAKQLEKTVAKNAELHQMPGSPPWFGSKSWFSEKFGKSWFGAEFGKTEAEKCGYWITVLAWLFFPAATCRIWWLPLGWRIAYFIPAVVIFILATLSLFSYVKCKHRADEKPLFRKLDNHMLRVADLDAAISFYRDKLGHRLLWRSEEAAGFALPETDAELVVHLCVGPETDIVVEDVEKAFATFVSAGGEPIERPFDIRIGRCARLRDPFGNPLVILDKSKGKLTTDAEGRVIGVERLRSSGAAS